MALTKNLNRDPKLKPQGWTALECMNFVEVPKPKEDSPEVLSKRIASELFKVR